jgi:hypothetical protein
MRFTVSFAALVAALVLVTPAAHAQQPADSMRRRTDSGVAGAHDMMAMGDSADVRLDRLVKAMNAASGDRKVQAMADVINELVAERRMMHAHMRQMMRTGGMRRRMDSSGRGGAVRRPAAADSSAH